MSERVLLSIENLSVAFVDEQGRRQSVIQDVSFEVGAGECVGLVGESGSGKTLTSLSCARLLPQGAMVHEKSRILFDGRDLLTCTEHQMRHVRGQHIASIFQEALSALNPVMTIGQQMQEVLKNRLTRRHRYQEALDNLREVGLKDPERCYYSYPHELSGGMRQRAMIAIALCGDPKLLLADEPTTALDVTVQAQVLELLQTLRTTRNLSILLISHDLSVVGQIADHVVVMKEGRIVEQGKADRFFMAPQHLYSQSLLSAILPLTPQRPERDTSSICACQGLHVTFGRPKRWWRKRDTQHVAVSGVHFEVPRGGTLALVGESGSGKTTIGKAMMSLCHRDSGTFEWWSKGHEQSCVLSTAEMRRKVQMLFQDSGSAMNPRLLVQDSFKEALRAAGVMNKDRVMVPMIDEWLAEVGIDLGAKYRYPHQFSGGQKQRLCLARALMMNPELLILDEPTSALDVSIQLQILEILDRVQKKWGMSYLLITHNWSVVAYLADSVLVLQEGQVVESGSVSAVLTEPQHEYTQTLLAAAPHARKNRRTI